VYSLDVRGTSRNTWTVTNNGQTGQNTINNPYGFCVSIGINSDGTPNWPSFCDSGIGYNNYLEGIYMNVNGHDAGKPQLPEDIDNGLCTAIWT
jgi:hypothetical protein